MVTLARWSPGGAAELVGHSEAASREESSEESGRESSNFGDASIPSREEGSLGRARFDTIFAWAFVAYPEARTYPEAHSLVALFGSRGSGNTSTLNFASEKLGEVEGVSIRNGAMLPDIGAGFAATVGRLLGSDNGAKGSALA
jgi:hypothetical protein